MRNKEITLFKTTSTKISRKHNISENLVNIERSICSIISSVLEM